MARCARRSCGRWRPDALIRRGALGVHFDEGWFCSRACLDAHTQDVLEGANRARSDQVPPMPPVRLGALLVHQRATTMDAVRQALRAQARSGLRLGAQLLDMGAVSQEQVLRALSAQAGVGYLATLDTARVAAGPGGLSRDAVRALGLVPFELRADRQRLSVATAAPVRRVSIGALREMTGLAIEPYLVADEVFAALLAAYGSARPVQNATASAALRSLRAAAAHIADAAEQGRARRMQHARCDPFVWVRLEGASGNEDMLLPIEAAGVPSWQAEPTRR